MLSESTKGKQFLPLRSSNGTRSTEVPGGDPRGFAACAIASAYHIVGGLQCGKGAEASRSVAAVPILMQFGSDDSAPRSRSREAGPIVLPVGAPADGEEHLADSPPPLIQADLQDYLKEEILAEGLTRTLVRPNAMRSVPRRHALSVCDDATVRDHGRATGAHGGRSTGAPAAAPFNSGLPPPRARTARPRSASRPRSAQQSASWICQLARTTVG